MKTSTFRTAFCAGLLAASVAARAEHSPVPRLSPDEVQNAKTPEQQRALAAAYEREAKTFREKAEAHRYMESHYVEPGRATRNVEFQRHCRKLASALEDAAKEADALAREHREMADILAEPPK